MAKKIKFENVEDKLLYEEVLNLIDYIANKNIPGQLDCIKHVCNQLNGFGYVKTMKSFDDKSFMLELAASKSKNKN